MCIDKPLSRCDDTMVFANDESESPVQHGVHEQVVRAESNDAAARDGEPPSHRRS